MAEEKTYITYAEAGVDITEGNKTVEKIKPAVQSTFRPEVITDLGGFGGLFALQNKYKNPVLVSGTDGVGTKLKLAFLLDKHDTIGIDAVAMCVNDILVSGAEPLFFLDYLAVGTLSADRVTDIVAGVAEGCRQAGCALIGGETAEMPGFYKDDEYDVAGFAVGVIEKDRIIDGKDIKPGDIVIGLPSTGLHSNGFSLARKVLLDSNKFALDTFIESLGMSLGEAMLIPTRIYVKELLPLLQEDRTPIKGLAHITGGGLLENIPRILPKNCSVVLEQAQWPIPSIFSLIEKEGPVARQEMYRTFNMGIGMVAIVAEEDFKEVKDYFKQNGMDYYAIGKVVEGENKVEIRYE